MLWRSRSRQKPEKDPGRAHRFYVQQIFVKRWGGVMTIAVPDGQQRLDATWKGDNLWVENYDPQTNQRVFTEYSRGNLLQGRVGIKNCNPLGLPSGNARASDAAPRLQGRPGSAAGGLGWQLQRLANLVERGPLGVADLDAAKPEEPALLRRFGHLSADIEQPSLELRRTARWLREGTTDPRARPGQAPIARDHAFLNLRFTHVYV